MLKFFRRIRQRLLAENKFSKYLFYALGEILLVVIGILIALQINIWNESRKQSVIEMGYLHRLKKDFESNLMEANRNISMAKFQSENAELLIKSLHKPLNEEESIRWFYALNHVWFLPHPHYTENVWDELKSTGSLNIFTNKELATKITEFYSQLESVNKYEEEWGTFNLEYRNKVNTILSDSLRQLFLEHLKETGDFELKKSVPDVQPYIHKLKSVEGIEGLIGDIRINRNVGSQNLNHGLLKTQINEILEILNDELRH